jgi:hypothetical protein
MALGPAELDGDVLALHVPGFSQALAEGRDEMRERSRRPAVQKADQWKLRLLRPRASRPRYQGSRGEIG